MLSLIKGKATICIVNYKTLDFTRLCLDSIPRFTTYPYEVIVVDNDSQEESLQYLKSLKWIRLIERRTKADESSDGHIYAAALNLGMENCNTEFGVSIHSDVFVHKDGRLGNMAHCFSDDETGARVGSEKIEPKPAWKIRLQQVINWKTFNRKLLKKLEPLSKFRYCNDITCCLYRMGILRLSHQRSSGVIAKRLY